MDRAVGVSDWGVNDDGGAPKQRGTNWFVLEDVRRVGCDQFVSPQDLKLNNGLSTVLPPAVKAMRAVAGGLASGLAVSDAEMHAAFAQLAGTKDASQKSKS